MLIAKMNDTWASSQRSALDDWGIHLADQTNVYSRSYPAPPPLNLVALLYHGVEAAVRGLCDLVAVRYCVAACAILGQGCAILCRRRSADVEPATPAKPARPDAKGRRLSFADDHTQRAAEAARQSADAANSPHKNKGVESRTRLQQELMRQGTRTRLMRGNSTLMQQSKALFTQREQERAEDTARYAYLQHIESNRDFDSGARDDLERVLSIAKRAFQQGADTHDAVEKLRDGVANLEVKALEGLQQRHNQGS